MFMHGWLLPLAKPASRRDSLYSPEPEWDLTHTAVFTGQDLHCKNVYF